MEIYETNTIRVYRTAEISPNEIQIGDRIKLNKGYTATCQEITPDGALFMLDTYFEMPISMNTAKTNKGGYMDSDLRIALKTKAITDLFEDYWDYMAPFSNGDMLRLPCYSEIFGEEDAERFSPDGGDQWELMKDKLNRAVRVHGRNERTWGWLQNRKLDSTTDFAVIGTHGHAGYFNNASAMGGLRPVFKIMRKPEEQTATERPTITDEAATTEENEYDVTFD